MKHNNLSANKVAREFETTRRNILFWKSGLHQPPKERRERLMEHILNGLNGNNH